MEDIINGTLVPLGICVALPVLVVWLSTRSDINKENRNAEVLIEAIRNNAGVDTDRLAEALSGRNKSKTPLELLNLRLLRGSIFSLIGLVFIIATIILVNGGYDLDLFGLPLIVGGLPLIVGGVFLAVGIGYLIVYFVSKKQICDKPEE